MSFSVQVSLPLNIGLDDVRLIADTSESVTLTCVASYSLRQPSGYSWSKDGAGLSDTTSSVTIPYNSASNIYSNSCARKLPSVSGVQCNSTYQCSASLSGIQGTHLTTANVIVSLSKQHFVRTLERLLARYVSVKSKLQHAPPRATPRAFDVFENYCSNSPLPGPKCRSNAPHQGPFR